MNPILKCGPFKGWREDNAMSLVGCCLWVLLLSSWLCCN